MSAPIPAPPPDASLTLRGLINTASQSIAGTKTFRDGIIVDGTTLTFDTTNHRAAIGADISSGFSAGAPSRLYILSPFLSTPAVPTNASTVYVMSEITSTLGNTFYGGFFNSEFNPQAPSSANVRSLMAALTVKNNQAMSGFLYAAQNQLDIDPSMSSTVANASAHFAIAQTKAGVTGTVALLTGMRARVDSQGAGSTITEAIAVYAQNGATVGTVSNKAGVVIEEQTGGGHNTNLLIGTATVPTTGDYALYSASARTSAIAGPLQYQDGTAQPTAGGLGILQFGVTSCVDTQFLPPGLGAALASAVTVPVPFTGTCRAMYVVANTTGVANYKFTIVKNGVDFNNAALGSSGAGTSVLGAPSLFTVTAGDKIAVRMNNLGGVGNPANVTVTLSFGVGT